MRISNNQKLNFRALKSINYERNFNPNRNNECNYLLRDFRDSEAIKEYCNKNDVNAYIGFSQDNRETRAWVDLTSKGKIISIFTYTDNNSKKAKGVSPAQRVLVSLGNYTVLAVCFFILGISCEWKLPNFHIQ